MPPKKRNPESDGPTQTKRRKKKKDEFDVDSDDDVENNGNVAASLYEEPESTIDIVSLVGFAGSSETMFIVFVCQSTTGNNKHKSKQPHFLAQLKFFIKRSGYPKVHWWQEIKKKKQPDFTQNTKSEYLLAIHQ